MEKADGRRELMSYEQSNRQEKVSVWIQDQQRNVNVTHNNGQCMTETGKCYVWRMQKAEKKVKSYRNWTWKKMGSCTENAWQERVSAGENAQEWNGLMLRWENAQGSQASTHNLERHLVVRPMHSCQSNSAACQSACTRCLWKSPPPPVSPSTLGPSVKQIRTHLKL